MGQAQRSGRWVRTLAALRDRPHQWANVGPAHRSTVALILKGQLGGAVPGEFEVTSRACGRADGKVDIYARYVGGEVSA